MKNCKYLSTIDLTSSIGRSLLHQNGWSTQPSNVGKNLPIHSHTVWISTSQAVLIQALGKVFEGSVENFTLVYIDDISVISPDFCSHQSYLSHIFQKLKDANMLVKFNKSLFCWTSVLFLGYTMTSLGCTKYILIVLDIFINFVKLYPIRSADTKTIYKKLFDLHFPIYGTLQMPKEW